MSPAFETRRFKRSSLRPFAGHPSLDAAACNQPVQSFSCKAAISSKRHAGSWVDDTLAAADECAEASPPLQQLAAPPAQPSLPHVVQASGKVRLGAHAPSMQHRANATCHTNACGAGIGDPEQQLFELASAFCVSLDLCMYCVGNYPMYSKTVIGVLCRSSIRRSCHGGTIRPPQGGAPRRAAARGRMRWMRPAPAVSATVARQAPAWTATGASAYLSACLKLHDNQ